MLGSEVLPDGPSKTKNILWIGANLLFDTQTGATNQVLMFVHREEDASVFTKEKATDFLNFVKVRAERFDPGIKWTVEQSRRVPQRVVIQGVQDAV
jgi:hypothetical protein